MQQNLANGWKMPLVLAMMLTGAFGCTSMKHSSTASPTGEAAVAAPTAVQDPPANRPADTVPAVVVTPKPQTSTTTAQATAVTPKQSQPAAKSAAPAEMSTANTPSPTKTTPAKAPTVSATTPEKLTPAKPAVAVASAAPPEPAAPTLDMKSLEQRLRDTRAIGMMTKLSLKNQVDDLLDEFRDFYAGKVKTPISVLRQKYDLLLMKVLSVLQDGDAALASAISSSREFLWGILRDPKKFADIDA